MRITLAGLAALYVVGCTPIPPTEKVVYQGNLPEYGETQLTTWRNPERNPAFSASIESEALDDPNHPFRRHSLVDYEDDGNFDYGVFPHRPKGTNISMSRKVFPDDVENSTDFFRLERIVGAALAARGNGLKVVERTQVKGP